MLSRNDWKAIERAVRERVSVGDAVALAVLDSDDAIFADVLEHTTELRRLRSGNAVSLCAIINAKSGKCSEDCRFCAQSAHHDNAQTCMTFPLLSQEEILAAREKAGEHCASRFSPVTSGRALTWQEQESVRVLPAKGGKGPRWCASLGCLPLEALRDLKEAGFRRYHHNLETAESFYPSICTTHGWEVRLETMRNAKKAGLEVCSGGLLGMGESPKQRVELARVLAQEKPNSIPLNFLMPIPGTPLEHQPALSEGEILRTIAMFRLTNPNSELRVAAGRAYLGDRQHLVFQAGCDGVMIGDFLTAPGRSVRDDLEAFRKLGLEPDQAE